MVDYLNEPFEVIDKPLWWQERGLQYTATGYGSKIPSSKMLRINKRLYRVYVVICSNAGSAYIIRNGKRLYLHDTDI